MDRPEKTETCPTCGATMRSGETACQRCALSGALKKDDTTVADSKSNGVDDSEGMTGKSGWNLEGRTIGNYRFLEKLGEGGMGQVYIAERRQPIKQKVAVKVIKPGMGSKEILARFDMERQALAIMDHPNVARILDAGTLDDGLPFFVMDLVIGLPINEYCDQKKLNIEERLSLFHQVCQGVQHAHFKGIIHRDIKPSNVIVTVNNGQAIPKVIDFGIAKATGIELTDQTFHTLQGQIVGTPQYMSPEQAVLGHSEVDTRTDVYSLGAMLYELLTGQHPISFPDSSASGLEETLAAIREKEPVSPSSRVVSIGKDRRETVAGSRSIPFERLKGQLNGDLDWITLKALEKDPARRYATANAFASDILAYLRKEEVSATPPTLRYRLSKRIKRNRGPILAFSAVFLALFLGLVGSLWQGYRATTEARNALNAEQEAIRNLEHARVQTEKAVQARKEADESAREAKEALREAERAKETAEAAKMEALASKRRAEDAMDQLKVANSDLLRAKQEADELRAKEEMARKEAENALADLKISKLKEDQGKIAINDLEARITEMLKFLRSGDIRANLQKRNANGVEIIQAIDSKLSRVFPEIGNQDEIVRLNYELALNLGLESIASFDTSLSTAYQNLQAAMAIQEEIEENGPGSPPGGPREKCQCFLGLGEIETLRGHFAEAENWLKEADRLMSGSEVLEKDFRVEWQILKTRLHHSRSRPVDEMESARKAVQLATPKGDGPFLTAAIALLLRGDASLKELQNGLVGLDNNENDLLAVTNLILLMREFDELEEPGLTAKQLLARFERYRVEDSEAGTKQERLRDLRLTRELAEILSRKGDIYEALQTYSIALDQAVGLSGLDGELIYPVVSRFEVCSAMGSLYAEVKDSFKRLGALNEAHQALLALRERNYRLGEKIEEAFFQRLVEATIRQFYVASGSESVFEENAFVAAQAEWFSDNSLKSREEILLEQIDHRQRYPHRVYRVDEIMPLEGNPEDGFHTVVKLTYWVADPKKENTIKFREPDGKVRQEVGLAFDASANLRFTKMVRIESEKD